MAARSAQLRQLRNRNEPQNEKPAEDDQQTAATRKNFKNFSMKKKIQKNPEKKSRFLCFVRKRFAYKTTTVKIPKCTVCLFSFFRVICTGMISTSSSAQLSAPTNAPEALKR